MFPQPQMRQACCNQHQFDKVALLGFTKWGKYFLEWNILLEDWFEAVLSPQWLPPLPLHYTNTKIIKWMSRQHFLRVFVPSPALRLPNFCCDCPLEDWCFEVWFLFPCHHTNTSLVTLKNISALEKDQKEQKEQILCFITGFLLQTKLNFCCSFSQVLLLQS